MDRLRPGGTLVVCEDDPGAAALGHGQGYVYSHDEPHAVARQQYAPDPLVGRDYYRPKPIGHEKRLTEQVAALRRIIRGD